MADRIVRVEAWPVNVPLDAPYLFALGTYRGLSHTIVRVTTADGIVGLGEAFSWQDAAIVEALADEIVGQDPLALRDRLGANDTGPLNAYAQFDGVSTQRAWAAIEIALWDIEARRLGQPIHRLLGAQARDAMEVTEYFAFRPDAEPGPQEVAEFCGRMIDEYDAEAFEGKVATESPAVEMEMLRLVRNEIGDRELRLDANLGWRLSTAIELLPELHALGVSGIEEPVGTWEETAELRRHTTMQFSAHEPDFDRQRALGVPDVFVLSVLSCGGIARTVRTIERCRRDGIGFWFYSGEMGVATAACLQVAAAVEHVGRSQSLLRWQVDDVIAGGPFVPQGGKVAVPEGPGLGVDLDPTALDRCIHRFADKGAYVIYDAPALPRW